MLEFKTAVVGGGFIGGAHVETLRRIGNVDVAALCDADGAEQKAARLNIREAYTDYRKMIDDLKPDVIHICTPNNTHYEIAKYAIERNVNVICEKPFTKTVEEAEELIELARKNNVKGAVNFHCRLYPIPNQMHHMIKHQELGDIVTVHGSYIQDWLLYETDYSWRLNADQVGKTRAVADIGCHLMDLMEFVTGLKIKEVNAQFSTVHPIRKKPLTKVQTYSKASADAQYEDIPIDTEDAATVMFKLENGAIGTAIISQVFAGKKNAAKLCIAGKACSITWDSERIDELLIGHRSQPNKIMVKDAEMMYPEAAALADYPSGHMEGFPDAFKQVFRQFYNSLFQDGAYSYATLEDGLREIKLCEAILKSAKTNKWCEV